MMTRIADDDVAVSSVLCGRCVGKMGSAVYPPPLKHSSEEEGVRVKAVDILLEVIGPIFKITRLNRNANFCLTGLVWQARTRFLPPLRPPLVCRSVRTGWLAGALALTNQRENSVAHVRSQGLLTCLELMRLGHTARDQEVALRCIQHSRIRSTAQYLALVMRELKRESFTREGLTRAFWKHMLPWIGMRLRVGMIPGAVE